MWFGVLGRLEVRSEDGNPLSLTGPARRKVLAALLCRRGRVIPASSLIDDLWGAAAPRSAAKTLQSHIVRLRDDLGRGEAASLLRTEGDGYRFAVDIQSVDAGRFEQLANAAHTATGVDRPGQALDLFDDALRLWRDEAYLDFGDAPFAVSERMRLAELRMNAREGRTDVALACGQSDVLVPELEQRVRAEPYRERGWEQLVVAMYRAGRQSDALGAARRARHVLTTDLGIDPGPGLRNLESKILRQDPDLLSVVSPLRSMAGLPASGVCPYLGLAAYEERDAAMFVGRERLTAVIAGRIADQSVVVVAGASGVGKSSLVRAGLLPSLRAGALPGSSAWRVAVRTPSEAASEHLVQRFEVLVLDQAEELFTALDPQERTSFLDRLERYIEDGGRLVLVLRSDFYGRLADLALVAPWAEKATVLLGSMREDELRRALLEPAANAGLELEPDLVETIMQEVAGQPEPLPQLSQALVRTWSNRDGEMLTLSGFRRAGGLEGALEAAAEDCYERLSDQAREAARHLLVRLATRSGTSWIRKPLLRADLTSAQDPATTEALAALVFSRLVMVGDQRVEITHDALLVHWPRLRDWLDERAAAADLVDHLDQQATSWQASGRQPADLYRGPRLHAALDWRTGHSADVSAKESEFLTASAAAAESELDVARAQLRREARGRRRLRFVILGLACTVVLAVLGGGIAVHEGTTAQQQATRAEEASLTSDASRVAGLALTASDISTSSLLAVAGFRLQDSPDTRNALLAVLERDNSALYRMPFGHRLLRIRSTADGRHAFVMDNLRDIDVIDPVHRSIVSAYPARADSLDAVTPDGSAVVVSGQAPGSTVDAGQVVVLAGATGAVRAVLPVISDGDGPRPVITGDGNWLAVVEAADQQGKRIGSTVALFNTHDWAAAPRTIRLPEQIAGVATSGDHLAVATSDGTLRILTATTLATVALARHPELAAAAEPGQQYLLAMSPDGVDLAVATESVRIFRVGDLRQTGHIVSARDDVTDLGFSPDAGLLAATSQAGTVEVDDVRTQRPSAQLAGHSGPALGLTWTSSPTGTALYTVGLDSEMVRWDVRAGSRLVTQAPSGIDLPDTAERFGNLVVGVTPTQDGSRRASTEALFAQNVATGVQRSWHLGLADGDYVNQTVASSDGRYALVSLQHGDGSNTIELWNLVSGHRTRNLVLPPDTARSIGLAGGLTPDDAEAVVSTAADRVGIFSLDSGAMEREFTVRFASPSAQRLSVIPWQIDPNGRMLVAGYDPGPPALAPAAVAAQPIPGGDATPANHRLGLLDVKTGRLLAQVGLGNDYATAVGWSHDGKLIAVGTYAGRLLLYDATTLARIGDAGVAHSGWILSASFSPDNSALVTGGTDGMNVWSVPGLVREGAHIDTGTGVGSGWWFAWYGPDGTIEGLAPLPDRGGFAQQGRFSFPGLPRAWATAACRLAGEDISTAQWARYLGSRPYRHVCPR